MAARYIAERPRFLRSFFEFGVQVPGTHEQELVPGKIYRGFYDCSNGGVRGAKFQVSEGQLKIIPSRRQRRENQVATPSLKDISIRLGLLSPPRRLHREE